MVQVCHVHFCFHRPFVCAGGEGGRGGGHHVLQQLAELHAKLAAYQSTSGLLKQQTAHQYISADSHANGGRPALPEGLLHVSAQAMVPGVSYTQASDLSGHHPTIRADLVQGQSWRMYLCRWCEQDQKAMSQWHLMLPGSMIPRQAALQPCPDRAAASPAKRKISSYGYGCPSFAKGFRLVTKPSTHDTNSLASAYLVCFAVIMQTALVAQIRVQDSHACCRPTPARQL